MSIVNLFETRTFKEIVFLILSVILSFIIAKITKKYIAKKAKEYTWNEDLEKLIKNIGFWGTLILSLLVFFLLMLYLFYPNYINELAVFKLGLAVGTKVVKTAVILLIGRYIVLTMVKILSHILKISRISVTLHSFICSTTKIFFYILIIMMSLESLEIPTSSLFATLASAGFAIALSIKDHLSNLIGGIVILFAHPFEVDDLVEIDGVEGLVSEIGLIYTVLKTFDNRVVLIPNNDTARAKIVNHSAETLRRLDMTFSIGYNDDYEKARLLILEIAKNTGLCLDKPEPFVRMKEHGESAIFINCRLWTDWDNYFELKTLMTEEVKRVFDEHSIVIPYNQMDIHIIDAKK